MEPDARKDPAVPETEAKARRLQEITAGMKTMATDQDALTTEREALMVALHDDGWNNVQIATAAGLTRARVSSILKPLLDARGEKVAATG
jgi:hypothetical protein